MIANLSIGHKIVTTFLIVTSTYIEYETSKTLLNVIHLVRKLYWLFLWYLQNQLVLPYT